MAKKKEEKVVDINSLTPEEKKKRIAQAMDTLREFSPMVSFLDNAMSNVDAFEDTGCYVLNALLSGHLRGGFPEARMSLLSAESSCLPEDQKIKVYRMRSQRTPVDILFD